MDAGATNEKEPGFRGLPVVGVVVTVEAPQITLWFDGIVKPQIT